MNVQEADIQTVLRSFSKFTGKNFVADKAVNGKVTVSLKDVPWLEALVAILDSQSLGYQEQGDIVRIGTKEELRKEMLDEAAAERKSEDLLPLVTRVVPLNFAKADEMKETLKTIRRRYRGRIWIVLDNLSAHKTPAIRAWARAHNVRLQFLPTDASWLNRIECQFTHLKTNVLTHCDYPSLDHIGRAIQRYLRWRNPHMSRPLSLKRH